MCDCISKIDGHLKEKAPNTMLVLNMIGPQHAVIATCKRDPKKREKPAYMMATYCPFCGDKYSGAQQEGFLHAKSDTARR